MAPPEEKEISSLRTDKIKAANKGNWREVSEICNFLGSKYSERGRLQDALEQHEEELKICMEKLRDPKGVLLAHRCLGEVYSEMEEYKRALTHLKTYLESAEKLKDIVEIQRAWATLGRTYYMKEDLKNGETAFKMALKLADR